MMKIFVRILFLVTLATVLLLTFIRFSDVMKDQLFLPFDIGYESPNLSTIHLIQKGHNPYDREFFSKMPFILTVYTPLYHYLVSLFPSEGENPFFYGRLLALVAATLSVITIFWVKPKKCFGVSLLAIGLYFFHWPIMSQSVFLKNDFLALFFSSLVILVLSRRKAIYFSPYFASLGCFLALFSKQSYLTPILVCSIISLVDWKDFGKRYFLSMAFLSICSIFFIQFFWSEDFWFSTFFSLKDNPTSWENARPIFSLAFTQPLLSLTTFLTFATLILYFYNKKNRRSLFATPYPYFVLCSWVIALLLVRKLGASTNYFYEVILSQVMWLTFFFKESWCQNSHRPFLYLMVLVSLLGAVIYDYRTFNRRAYSLITQEIIEERKEQYARTKKVLAQRCQKNPKILIPHSQLHTYSVQSNVFLNDPFIYSILFTQKKLDSQPLLEAVRDRYFDAILLSRKRSSPPKDVFGQAAAYYYELGYRDDAFSYYFRSKE